MMLDVQPFYQSAGANLLEFLGIVHMGPMVMKNEPAALKKCLVLFRKVAYINEISYPYVKKWDQLMGDPVPETASARSQGISKSRCRY